MIRNIVKNDLNSIVKEESKLFGFNFKSLYERAIKNDFYNCLVYESDEKIKGVILFSISMERAEIVNFFVFKEFHNNGFGKTLFELSLQQLKNKNIKTCLLEVKRTNRHAIELYKQFGFVLIGVRQKYYDDNTDGLVMLKENVQCIF